MIVVWPKGLVLHLSSIDFYVLLPLSIVYPEELQLNNKTKMSVNIHDLTGKVLKWHLHAQVWRLTICDPKKKIKTGIKHCFPNKDTAELSLKCTQPRILFLKKCELVWGMGLFPIWRHKLFCIHVHKELIPCKWVCDVKSRIEPGPCCREPIDNKFQLLSVNF